VAGGMGMLCSDNCQKTVQGIQITHLGYTLQGTVETPIAMMLRMVDACICHLRHRR